MHRSTWLLIGVLGFNALTAVVGGIGVMINGLGMPLEYLSGTPFPNYIIPGLVLTLFVGVGSLVVAILIGRQYRYAHEASYVAGVVMIGWIVGEFAFLRQFSWLQVFYFVDGILVILLAYISYSRKTSGADS